MYNTFSFDLGRNALSYFIKEFGITQIHIPYYLCDVIRHSLAELKCKAVFYHIDDNFYPDYEFKKEDFILYPNYFGICTENTKKLAQKYSNLIVDNAHAYFDEPLGVACFNVGHKFGLEKSMLWIKSNNNNFKRTLSREEEKLKTLMYEKFDDLNNEYGKTNLIKINSSYASCIYPFLAKTTEDADELVKELKKKGKTIYRYWHPLPKSFNEYKFYLKLVPIPVLPVVN